MPLLWIEAGLARAEAGMRSIPPARNMQGEACGARQGLQAPKIRKPKDLKCQRSGVFGRKQAFYGFSACMSKPEASRRLAYSLARFLRALRLLAGIQKASEVGCEKALLFQRHGTY